MKRITKQVLKDTMGHVTVGDAYCILLVNLILPGAGTAISVRKVTPHRLNKMQLEIKDNSKRLHTSALHHVGIVKQRGYKLGGIQFLTFPLLLVGWLWALYFSIKLIGKAKAY